MSDDVMTPQKRADEKAREDHRQAAIKHFEAVMEESMGHLRDALRMSNVARNREPKEDDRLQIYYAMQRCNDALLRAAEKFTEAF